jgi:hypothetical protein
MVLANKAAASLADKYRVPFDPKSVYFRAHGLNLSRYNVPRMIRGYGNSVMNLGAALYRHMDGEDSYARNNGSLSAYKQ